MASPPARAEAARSFLRRLTLFSGLSDEDFERIHAMARPVTLEAGATLMEEGAPGDSMYVVVEGELEVTRREGAREVVLASRGAGEFVGELSLLQRAPRSATVRALARTDLLEIQRPAFETLVTCSPAAVLTMLGTVTARLGSTEALLREQEKLAALGKMAAGLLHELNNPAAAIRRSMEHLRRAVAELSSAAGALAAIDPGRREALRELRSRRAAAGDPLARARAEEAVQAWLEERGIERAWEIAPVLAAEGIDLPALAELAGRFTAGELQVVVRWLSADAEVQALVSEATTSAGAISDIVSSAKHYARVDQAPVLDVDVHETLEDTLVMLRHKLGGMRVAREYAPDLPRIEALASALSQVWTNLVDNAIDATAGRGEIVLRTRASPAGVVVEIEDDGPGIPAEARSRVFEPFFTTKPPGSGTGLGLHVTRNIVVDQHRGQIDVESRPGRTLFTVRLPLRLPRR